MTLLAQNQSNISEVPINCTLQVFPLRLELRVTLVKSRPTRFGSDFQCGRKIFGPLTIFFHKLKF